MLGCPTLLCTLHGPPSTTWSHPIPWLHSSCMERWLLNLYPINEHSLHSEVPTPHSISVWRPNPPPLPVSRHLPPPATHIPRKCYHRLSRGPSPAAWTHIYYSLSNPRCGMRHKSIRFHLSASFIIWSLWRRKDTSKFLLWFELCLLLLLNLVKTIHNIITPYASVCVRVWTCVFLIQLKPHPSGYNPGGNSMNY